MTNVVFDFRHAYQRGERVESEEAIYQYDVGRVAEMYVPETAELFFLHVGMANRFPFALVDVDSVEAVSEGGYKVTASIPDSILTEFGTMLVYLVAAEGSSIVTTYEGAVTVKNRAAAEDYVVPDEQASSIVERAEIAAQRAETAASVIESGGMFTVTDPNNDGNIIMTVINN